MRCYMQQTLQSSVSDPQPGKTAVVGKFPDAEAGPCPLPDSVDSPPEVDEVQPHTDNSGTCGAVGCGTGDHSRKSSCAAWMLIQLIRLYQKTVSPWLGAVCRFEPSCSHYGVEALQKHGFWKGSLLTVWRIMRCQPFCKGGYDPVPEVRKR